MFNYIARRLLLMVPTLLGITIVVFVVMVSAPGGITARSLVEVQDLEPETRKALEDYYNKLYGLDQPAPMQYFRWLNNVSPIGFTLNANNEIDGFSFTKGIDLGRSFTYGRPVTELLYERVPITLLLNIIAIPIIYLIAITIGVRAATKRGESFDVSSSFIMLALWSIPTMLAGVLLMGYFASDQYWHWFPTTGLSYREAFDMPFMPHWSNIWDPVKLIMFAMLGGFGLTILSQRLATSQRAILIALIGGVLGWFMAQASAVEAGVTMDILFVLVLGLLGYSLGAMQYQSFRTITIGLLGMFLGAGIAAATFQGDFVRGFLVDRIWHLTLPIICFTYGGFAFLSKLSRTAILENLLSDYARTARAKGVREHDVLWRHVFRNSLLPLITVSATLLPSLLSGSVIVEHIFSIDGMGKLAVQAVQSRDRELVLSITLISGVLTLIGYLIADVCYAIADPRISYE